MIRLSIPKPRLPIALVLSPAEASIYIQRCTHGITMLLEALHEVQQDQSALHCALGAGLCPRVPLEVELEVSRDEVFVAFLDTVAKRGQ